jgi:hypothetical protein
MKFTKILLILRYEQITSKQLLSILVIYLLESA